MPRIFHQRSGSSRNFGCLRCFFLSGPFSFLAIGGFSPFIALVGIFRGCILVYGDGSWWSFISGMMSMMSRIVVLFFFCWRNDYLRRRHNQDCLSMVRFLCCGAISCGGGVLSSSCCSLLSFDCPVACLGVLGPPFFSCVVFSASSNFCWYLEEICLRCLVLHLPFSLPLLVSVRHWLIFLRCFGA